jgi:LacI family transcriptional regulator
MNKPFPSTLGGKCAQQASIRTIAAAAGFGKTLVAKVMTNKPGVAASTRTLVLKVAREQGYLPDPEITRLMLHVRHRRTRRNALTMAWIRYAIRPAVPQNFPWFAKIWAGASARSQALGFSLDQIIEDVNAMSPARFVQILRARGVSGLLASPPWQAEVFWRLEVQDFAIAIAGEGNLPYIYDQSGPDYFHNIRLLMQELALLGYRRPGLVISDYMHMVSAGAIVAAYEYSKLALPPEDRIPWESPVSDQNEALSPWLKRWCPDVLICANNNWAQVLAQHGLRVPEDIGLAHINLASDIPDWGGIDQNHEWIGANAVNLLAEQIYHREHGRPVKARRVLAAGQFVRGSTLKVQS